MITQPEQIQKASVTLNLMRQEMDVLRESKSTVSAEIRAAIKEKRDVIDELPSIHSGYCRPNGLISLPSPFLG